MDGHRINQSRQKVLPPASCLYEDVQTTMRKPSCPFPMRLAAAARARPQRRPRTGRPARAPLTYSIPMTMLWPAEKSSAWEDYSAPSPAAPVFIHQPAATPAATGPADAYLPINPQCSSVRSWHTPTHTALLLYRVSKYSDSILKLLIHERSKDPPTRRTAKQIEHSPSTHAPNSPSNTEQRGRPRAAAAQAEGGEGEEGLTSTHHHPSG